MINLENTEWLILLYPHSKHTVKCTPSPPYTASDESWSDLVHSHYFKRLQSAQIQRYVLLHNATPAWKSLIRCSATCRLTSHLSAHHCHIPAQHNCSNRHLLPSQHRLKGRRPGRRLRVMAGMKAPLSPPSLSESHRMAVGAQISSDISAVACYRHRPSVLNQNVRAWAWQEGWGPGRQVWRGPDRGPPLSPPSRRMPSSLSVAFYSTQRQSQRGGRLVGHLRRPYTRVRH